MNLFRSGLVRILAFNLPIVLIFFAIWIADNRPSLTLPILSGAIVIFLGELAALYVAAHSKKTSRPNLVDLARAEAFSQTEEMERVIENVRRKLESAHAQEIRYSRRRRYHLSATKGQAGDVTDAPIPSPSQAVYRIESSAASFQISKSETIKREVESITENKNRVITFKVDAGKLQVAIVNGELEVRVVERDDSIAPKPFVDPVYDETKGRLH